MNEYNVIFLDIDGVLNSEQYFCWNHNRHYRYGDIDPRETYRLYRFCKKYNVKLVISSTWRNGNGVNLTIDEFKDEHHHPLEILTEFIVGVTPYSNSRNRGTEIKYFFEIINDKNGKYKDYYDIFTERFHIKNYCIVDDDTDMLEEQLPYFVNTNFKNGLTRKDYKKIKHILNLNG